MALVLKDRVRESSTSSGTGNITLAGAFSGYQTFNSAVANGSTVYYTIHNTTVPNDGEWEVGVGTFTAPSTLSRDTVFSSSAGGTTKVSFSGSSTLEVFITQPAEQAIYINDATGKVEAFGNGTNTVTFTNVTADLFTGNASAISAINASNISSGTIANNRTTASSSNGANTIVLRGASGEFAAGIITADGSGLSAINASNISSGTIDNARTTASSSNGANTIVLRDASGNFTTNIITANGSAISAINASNVSSGTLADGRLSSNVVTLTGTQTLTNKTVTLRVDSSASITSPLAWNSDNFDQYAATAQAGALTINADAGTPTNGRKIVFRFKDNGTARALTWTTGSSKSFRAVGVTLPTTTVINKTVYVGCIFNTADDRWDAVAVAQEA